MPLQHGRILGLYDGPGMRDFASPNAYALMDDAFSHYTKQDFINAARIVLFSPSTTQNQKIDALNKLYLLDPMQATNDIHTIRHAVAVAQSTPANYKIGAYRMRDDPPSGGDDLGTQVAKKALGSTSLQGVLSTAGGVLGGAGAAAVTGAAVGSVIPILGTAIGAGIGALLGSGVLNGIFGGTNSPQGGDPNRAGLSKGDLRTFMDEMGLAFVPAAIYIPILHALPTLPIAPPDATTALTVIQINPGTLITWHNDGTIDQDAFSVCNGGWFFSFEGYPATQTPIGGTGATTFFIGGSDLRWGWSNPMQVIPVAGFPADPANNLYTVVQLNIQGLGLMTNYFLMTTYTDNSARFDAIGITEPDPSQLNVSLQGSTQSLNTGATTAAGGSVGFKHTQGLVQQGSASGGTSTIKKAAGAAGGAMVGTHAGCGSAASDGYGMLWILLVGLSVFLLMILLETNVVKKTYLFLKKKFIIIAFKLWLVQENLRRRISRRSWSSGGSSLS